MNDTGLPDPLGDALVWVRDGELVAYPTETVWGLGADATSAPALEALRRWKGRETAEPVSILVEHPNQLAELGLALPPAARRLVDRFWPGPLTLVLHSERAFAPGVAREDGAVGVRCSSHPLAIALARRCRGAGVGPLTATSLNRSGDDPARTADEASALCGDEAGVPHLLAVEGAEAGGDRESTVLDLAGDVPRVLRWGAIGDDALGPALRELGAG